MLVLILVMIFIVVVLILLKIRSEKYRKFLMNNSPSLKELMSINSRYRFYKSRNFDESYTYDNEIFYHNVSCEDYLIYQLQYKKYEIENDIRLINSNSEKYDLYLQEITEINIFGEYTDTNNKLNKKHLISMERKLFEKNKLKVPQTSFSINIKLYCAKMNGEIYHKKKQNFSGEYISYLIERLNKKKGNFYSDEGIWDSLCRVERGKVSNKMRFSIYERDGYRCKKCGRSDRFADLEIDHIKPIAKGGKSTYDNLQTLCRRCNKNKGDTYYS